MELLRNIIINIKKRKFMGFFFGCYFLFSFLLLILNLITTKIFNVVGIIVSLIFVIIFFKRKKNFIVKKPLLIILFVIPFILRLLMFFLEYGNIESDYLAFLSNAEAYANGTSVNSEYISLFPFLYSYIVLLGNVFKIFGNNYIFCVGLNLVIEMLGAIIFFFILRNKFGRKSALKGTLFYLYNPFNILWISKCCPVIVVNTMILAAIFCSSKLDFNSKKFWLWSLFVGVLTGITNSFRPFMIIYLIALLIYFISLYKEFFIKKLIVSFALICCCYFAFNRVYMFYVSNEINIDVQNSQSGFSLYVGSNVQEHGMWNSKDSELFYEKVRELGGTEAHKEVLRLAIERYKNNGVNNIWFLGYKAGMLGRNLDNYTFIDVFYSIKNSIPSPLVAIIRTYLSIYLYIMLLLNLRSSVNILKSETEINNYNYVGIFGMGLFVAMLLLEVSPRYFLLIMIPILIMAVLCLVKEESS